MFTKYSMHVWYIYIIIMFGLLELTICYCGKIFPSRETSYFHLGIFGFFPSHFVHFSKYNTSL